MIVVTTPTGAIGHQVVENLLATGAPVRVVARDPARLPSHVRDRVDVVPGSHGDPEVVTAAFAGAEAVLWVTPPDRTALSLDAVYVDFARPACEAFTRHGVSRVVGVSALGRGTALAGTAGPITASFGMDDLIASTGVSYRALALPTFMDNVLRQVESIRDQGVFRWPGSGEVRLPTCATRDIAAVAADLLRDSSWNGVGSVPVLGPEDLSFMEMTQIMSEVLGRTVRFEQIPIEAYRAQLMAAGLPPQRAQGMIDMAVAKDAGLDNAEPRTPRSTSPTSFRQWCEEVLKPATLA